MTKPTLSSLPTIATADLYDQYGQEVQVLSPIFHNYGKTKQFFGQVVTLKLYEDNTLVRETLGSQGKDKVLVVDGGGSLRCALIGDNLAELALKNQWRGLVIYGCVRDTQRLASLPIGIKAINHMPVKSIKNGEGQKNISLHFANAIIKPGDYLYSDEDGILVSPKNHTLINV